MLHRLAGRRGEAWPDDWTSATWEALEDDDDEAFNEKMERLTAQLAEQMGKGLELDVVIREKLGALGYGV